MAWVFPTIPIPVFRYNLFSIALGCSQWQLKKGFPLHPGLLGNHFNFWFGSFQELSLCYENQFYYLF